MDTRRNITKVELLAPAGSAETLQAVIEAGADAVYIGGARFGARAYADNPGEDSLLRAIDYAHLRGVKVYLTVNTLLTDREIAELFDYINPYYMAGLDAVIVQDLGVLSFLRAHFPKLPVHVSTQMTITDAVSSTLFDEGVTRIVPARELSLDEIRSMREQSEKELEIFAHGALCYSYSGQCLLSSLIGGRSGNRGRCAQPCRKEYVYEEGNIRKKGYLLSPKDQCLLPRLHELLETGIHSLKLEGRMKSLAYAAGVTAVYRKWIDRFYELGGEKYRKYLKEHPEEMREDIGRLAELFNRGGFCEGYVFGRKGPQMICEKRPNHTGVLVGTANVRKEKAQGTNDRNGKEAARYRAEASGRANRPERSVAVPTFFEPVGPGEVLEFRTEDERFACAEWTTPQDMDGYRIPPVPVVWKHEYGRMPDSLKLNIWRMRKEPLLWELNERFGKNRKPVLVTGSFVAEKGEAIKLSVKSQDGTVSVTCTGPVPEPATSVPADAASVSGKLMQTGQSEFAFDGLDVRVGDGLFLPVSVLKNLRREALAAFSEKLLGAFRRTSGIRAGEEWTVDGGMSCNGEKATADGMTGRSGESATADSGMGRPGRTVVSVMNAEQLQAVRESGVATDVYIDMEGDYEACFTTECALPRYLMLPRALKGAKLHKAIETAERMVREKALSGIVVRTMDELSACASKGILIEADRTLYCHNSTSVEYLLSKGVSTVTLSEELRKDELPDSARVLITVYGRSVAMVSEQCPRRTVGLCKKTVDILSAADDSLGARRDAQETVPANGRDGVLTDGEGEHFPLKAVCRYCHSLLYNAHIYSLLSDLPEVPVSRAGGIRLDFTLENGEETKEVLNALKEAKAGRRPEPKAGYTKRSWNHGTE